MNKFGKSSKILLLGFLLTVEVLVNSSYAQEVSSENTMPGANQQNQNLENLETGRLEQLNQANAIYEKGMNSLHSGMYVQAIEELSNALKTYPDNLNIKAGLAAAYNARGVYYSEKTIDFVKATSDFRTALYYLKYYDNSVPTDIIKQNIDLTEKNLENALKASEAELSPQSRYKKAKELRGEGKYLEAIVEFDAASADKKLKSSSFESIGDIMKLLSNDRKAAEYYDKALTVNSNNSNLHLKFARVLEKLGNLEIAGQEYNIALKNSKNKDEILDKLQSLWKQMLAQNPDNAIAHMNLGVVYQQKGDFQGAMTEYKAAEAIEPENPTLRLNIATLLQAQGDIDSAIAAYDSILATYPNNKQAHYYKATALKKAGKINEAIGEYETALAMDSNDTTLKAELINTIVNDLPIADSLSVLSRMAEANPDDAFITYNYAYLLHKNKNYDKAITYYLATLRIEPSFIDAYINLAAIYKNKSNVSEAKDCLKKALAIDSDNSKVQQLLADLDETAVTKNYEEAASKFKQKDYEGALKDYLAIETPTAEVYLGRGVCYQELGKIDKAIENYTQSLKMDSTNSDTYYYMGTAMFDKKQYDKALENYAKAKKLTPNNKDIDAAIKSAQLAKNEVLIDKGLALYESGKYKEALLIFNKAIMLDQKNGYLFYYRGMTYDAIKNYYLAISDYKKTLTLTNEIPFAYYALAVDYDSLKNKVDAKKAYQQFIAKSGTKSDEYTKYAKQRLKQL